MKSKNTRDLTPYQGVTVGFFATDPNFPDQVLAGLNVRDRRLFDVYRLNVRTGALELDKENPGDVGGWTADNNLQVRAAQVQLPDGGTEIRVRDDPKSPWRSFQKWGPDESFGGIAGFTPDNHGVYLTSSVGANAARLLEVDLVSGQTKVVAEDRQFDVGGHDDASEETQPRGCPVCPRAQ